MLRLVGGETNCETATPISETVTVRVGSNMTEGKMFEYLMITNKKARKLDSTTLTPDTQGSDDDVELFNK